MWVKRNHSCRGISKIKIMFAYNDTCILIISITVLLKSDWLKLGFGNSLSHSKRNIHMYYICV